MSRRPIWMPLYVGDFTADTLHLSATQIGCYVLLLLHYWQHGPLPDNDQKLARIGRVRIEDWRRHHRETLATFFSLGGGQWVHARVERELLRAAEISNKRRDAAVQMHMQKHTHARTHARASSTTTSTKSSEAVASGADAPRPTYTDSRHELFGEGVPILIGLGLKERLARSMIGSWLKQTGDDAEAVLAALRRAQQQRVVNPIPWVTASLKPKDKGNAQEARSLVAAARRAAQRIAGTGDVDHDTGQPVLRLIPKG